MKTERLSMPQHYNIFDYWKDKCITENGEVEIEYGYDGCDKEKLNKVNSIPVVNDWGEPHCFGCGEYIENIKNYDELTEGREGVVWHYFMKTI